MRDLVDLENNAYKFWPTELAEQEKNSSIIPKLIETQDKFISLLNISDASPIAWKETLNSTSSLSANLFLKHLVVLSDIGQARLGRPETDRQTARAKPRLDCLSILQNGGN